MKNKISPMPQSLTDYAKQQYPDIAHCFDEDGITVYRCSVTGTLQAIDEDGTEGSLELYVAFARNLRQKYTSKESY